MLLYILGHAALCQKCVVLQLNDCDELPTFDVIAQIEKRQSNFAGISPNSVFVTNAEVRK